MKTKIFLSCLILLGVLMLTAQINNTAGGGATNTINPTSYGAKFNAQVTPDATTTNTSNIVTCPNNDCKFLSTARAGQIFFATLGTGTSCLDDATINFGGNPQTTILSVDSDTQIHVTGNSDTTGTAISCIAWGDDDTTAINAAWTAGGCTASMVLPNGKTFISAAILQAIAGCPSIANAGTGYLGQRFAGQGVSSTYIIPVPNFNFATCPAKASGACISNKNVSDETNFTIWGVGQRCAATHAGIALYIVGDSTSSNRVGNVGWCGRGGGTTLDGIYISGGEDTYNIGGCNYFGTTCMEIANVNVTLENNTIQGNNFGTNAACQVLITAPSTVTIINTQFAGCMQQAVGTTVVSMNDLFISIGPEAMINTAGTMYLVGGDIVNKTPAPASFGIYFGSNTGIVRAQNSTISGGSAGGQYAVGGLLGTGGNIFQDNGGMTYVAGGSGIFQANEGTFLNFPQSGTAACAALTTGCTITFPFAFPVAPASCTANDLTAAAPIKVAAASTTTVVVTGGTGSANTDSVQWTCK